MATPHKCLNPQIARYSFSHGVDVWEVTFTLYVYYDRSDTMTGHAVNMCLSGFMYFWDMAVSLFNCERATPLE